MRQQPAQLSAVLPAEGVSKQGKRWQATLPAAYLPIPWDTNIRVASIIAGLTDKPSNKEHESNLLWAQGLLPNKAGIEWQL